MPPRVYVETNQVVDYASPILSRSPDARALYERATRGELTLHVPAIALIEARKVVRERSHRDVATIREFVGTLRSSGEISGEAATATFDALSRFEQRIKQEKLDAPSRIDALTRTPGVEVFPLDTEMLARSVELSASTRLELQSFDIAILAAVLVAAERQDDADNGLAFCTLDADLQCWDKNGKPKTELARLYDRARIWVFGDFLLASPPRPDGWPDS